MCLRFRHVAGEQAALMGGEQAAVPEAIQAGGHTGLVLPLQASLTPIPVLSNIFTDPPP
jgi:hypothetical protein